MSERSPATYLYDLTYILLKLGVINEIDEIYVNLSHYASQVNATLIWREDKTNEAIRLQRHESKDAEY